MLLNLISWVKDLAIVGRGQNRDFIGFKRYSEDILGDPSLAKILGQNMAKPEKSKKSLREINKHLVVHDLSLVFLFDPYFGFKFGFSTPICICCQL